MNTMRCSKQSMHEQQHKLTFRAATSSGNLFEEDRIITVRD